MIVYDHVRHTLWNPSDSATRTRAEMSKGLGYAKMGFGVGIATGVAVVALGVFAMANYPVLGCMIGLTGAFVGVTSREAIVMTENSQKVLRNTKNAAKASFTVAEFAHQILKDTWFCERYFKSALIDLLQEPAA